MRSGVTGIQFRIVEISERPALVSAAQMPIESSSVNVTFVRSNKIIWSGGTEKWTASVV
jgi:hypothetical protein